MLKQDQIAASDSLIDVKTTADKCGMKRSHLYALVRRGVFPEPAIRTGRFTRWRLSDVQAWIANPTAWTGGAA